MLVLPASRCANVRRPPRAARIPRVVGTQRLALYLRKILHLKHVCIDLSTGGKAAKYGEMDVSTPLRLAFLVQYFWLTATAEDFSGPFRTLCDNTAPMFNP